MDYPKMAEESYRTLLEHYYIKDENLFLENYEMKQEDRAVSFLWPFSGVISAINALAQIPGDGERYSKDLKNILDALEQYWNPKSDPVAYDSYVTKYGGGDQFYDDNEWLGLDFVEAYRILGVSGYLEKAKKMFDFAISGWSEEMDGGIYWRKGDKTTKNTCSNGPAAVLALKLYEETNDASYMDWAVKILDWTKRLESQEDGVYWDNIREDGSIDKHTYTYNVGTIIHANALLYAIKGDESYLNHAIKLASSSMKYFTRKESDYAQAFFPNSPWFNVILFKGLIALYRVDPKHDTTYIQAFQNNVNYAWEHAKDVNGLYSKDWSGNKGVDAKHKWLLDQAPMVEFYALLAALPR